MCAKPPKKSIAGPGAPQKQIDWDEVEKAIMEGCNGTQVAAFLGIHPDTLYLRCQNDHKVVFSAYYQEKREKGNKLLHQAQYRTALKGNPTMQIWLGKQRMKQRDHDDESAKVPPTDRLTDI